MIINTILNLSKGLIDGSSGFILFKRCLTSRSYTSSGLWIRTLEGFRSISVDIYGQKKHTCKVLPMWMDFHTMRRQLSSKPLTDTVQVVKMWKVKPQSSSCFLSKFMRQSAITDAPAPDYRAPSYTEEFKV